MSHSRGLPFVGEFRDKNEGFANSKSIKIVRSTPIRNGGNFVFFRVKKLGFGCGNVLPCVDQSN